DDNPDPAAFTPAVAEAVLTDGRRLSVTIDALPGSPARPLDRAAQIAKVRACLDFAGLPGDAADTLIRRVDGLEGEADMAALFRAVARAPA
ncbi:MAG: hypothetical protein RLY86_1019, partial [Pseudomonadota bacterium]